MVSKIESVTAAESYEDKYGQKWAFVYTFEDGTVIKAAHKSQASPFKPGQEAEYEIKGEYEGMSRGSVKKPGFNGQAPSNQPAAVSFNSPDRDERIGNQWAINAAIELLQLQTTSGSQITFEEIERTAKELIKTREILNK
jgi:hypothetical protein